MTEEMSMVILAAVAAFSLAYVMMPTVIALSWRIGAVDVPREARRMHTHPIPRAGGMGILPPVLLLCAVFGYGGEAVPILAGAGLMLLVGLADDVFCLSAPVKLLFQCAAAVAAVTGAGVETGTELLLSVTWVVLSVNAHNMIDGMDGLLCGTAAVESLFLAGALWLSGTGGAQVPLLLAAALLAFRCYNRYPAVTFAGDAGSESVGFLLGALTLPLFGGEGEFSALSPLFLLAYPLSEVLTSVLRRLLRGRSPFAADRAHLHHRLWAAGVSVPECVGLLQAVGASLCAVGLFLSARALYPYAAISCIAAVAVLLRVRGEISQRRAA